MTAATYRTAAAEARALRGVIAHYSTPLDVELTERIVARQGQAALDEMLAVSATFLAQKVARLAEVCVITDAWEAQACTRCSGTGDYQAPTSHYRGGSPVCFSCSGTGQK